jgi:hypothetical protein
VDSTLELLAIPLKRQSIVVSRSADAVNRVVLPPPLTVTHKQLDTYQIGINQPNIHPSTHLSTHVRASTGCEGIASTSTMYVDMTLATSYKPLLVCIIKVFFLMVFHYTSVPMLFVTERYAVMVAMLYVDKWLAYEYIIDTNSCLVVLAGSLLVHELRDAGVQERLHGEMSHNIVLSMLVASNIIVIVVGEHQSFWRLLGFPSTIVAPGTAEAEDVQMSSVFDVNSKRPRQYQQINPSLLNTPASIASPSAGPLMCVLITCALLVVLSTCAMPVSAHDPLLNNIRVWSFTALSLCWLYTINYRELRYAVVAPFTPCVLRFSSVLFLTPSPVAIGGILLMTACLASTHIWVSKQQHNMLCPDLVYQPSNVVDNVAVVLREPKSKNLPVSGISYRTPMGLLDKPACKPVSKAASKPASTNGSSVIAGGGAGGGLGVMNGCIGHLSFGDTVDADTATILVQPETLDYDSLFLQAMSENTV